MSQREEIENIVNDLRNAINQWNRNRERVRDLILDLARILNESGTIENHDICGKIKGLLKDEIEKKKVTPRWIEKVLEDDYKRKYTKSELSSLLEPRQIEVATTGEQIVQSQRESLDKESGYGDEHDDPEKVNTKFLERNSSDEESVKESVYAVSKDKMEEIVDCLKKCQKMCYLTFDGGFLIMVESDR